MATYTNNYDLYKIELRDAPPDITVINGNWDTIDAEMHDMRTDIDDLRNDIEDIRNDIDNMETLGVKVTSITLASNKWTGAGPFTQGVSISNITAKSKVDLQPNSTVLSQLITDGVSALYIANNNGVLTAYAVGAAPTGSLTIQATVMEVE